MKVLAYSGMFEYAVEGLLGHECEDAAVSTFKVLREASGHIISKDIIEQLKTDMLDAYAKVCTLSVDYMIMSCNAYGQVELHWPVLVMTRILHMVLVHGHERLVRAGGNGLSHMFFMEDYFGDLIAGVSLPCRSTEVEIWFRGIWETQKARASRDQEQLHHKFHCSVGSLTR
jgi:hypothetical protein